jgi:hypothetical protein
MALRCGAGAEGQECHEGQAFRDSLSPASPAVETIPEVKRTLATEARLPLAFGNIRFTTPSHTPPFGKRTAARTTTLSSGRPGTRTAGAPDPLRLLKA